VDKKVLVLILLAFLAGIGLILFAQNKNSLFKQFGLERIYNEQEEIAPPTPAPPISSPSPVSSPPPTNQVSPTTLPTLSPTPTTNPFAQWTSYTNATYQYQCLYDPTWNLNDSNPGSVSLQGNITNKGWPSIGINKLVIKANSIAELKTEVENSFSITATEITFGKNNIPAVLVEHPASPQSYASKNYYFLHNGNTLSISLNDTGNSQGDQIYNYFLNNFETL